MFYFADIVSARKATIFNPYSRPDTIIKQQCHAYKIYNDFLTSLSVTGWNIFSHVHEAVALDTPWWPFMCINERTVNCCLRWKRYCKPLNDNSKCVPVSTIPKVNFLATQFQLWNIKNKINIQNGCIFNF